jgi:hypothetical protein
VKVTNLPYLEGLCYVTNLPIEGRVEYVYIVLQFLTAAVECA